MPKAITRITVTTASRMLESPSSTASQTGALANVRPFPSTTSRPPKTMPANSLTLSMKSSCQYSLVIISLPLIVSMWMGSAQVP